MQLTLTLKMTTAKVVETPGVETSVTVNNNSPIQDYVHRRYVNSYFWGMEGALPVKWFHLLVIRILSNIYVSSGIQ